MQVLPIVDQASFSQNENINTQAFLTGYHSSRKLKSFNATKTADALNHAEYKSNKSAKFKLSNSKRNKRKIRRRRKAGLSQAGVYRMYRIMDSIQRVSKSNCVNLSPSSLMLPGDVTYGVETQFDPQARFALRIAYVLCAWMQKVEVGVSYASLKPPGRLHYDIVFAEVISAVMADHRVISVGVYFEPYMFEDIDGTPRELFGPFAYRNHDDGIYAIDSAGLSNGYTEEHWYVRTRERWQTNTSGLKKFRNKLRVRLDVNGTSVFKVRGMSYKAPPVDKGFWTHPYFRCDGMVDRWVITYVAPFFGYDATKSKLQFK